MLTTYFKRPTTWATYYASPAGPYLDAFTDKLAQDGYRSDTIRHLLQGAFQFGAWVEQAGNRLQPVSTDALARFHHHLAERGRLRVGAGPFSVCWLGARCFFAFLQTQQKEATPDTEPQTAQPRLLVAFENWMQAHRGVKASTLAKYRPHLVELLATLGEQPERFDAAQLRSFIVAYAERHNLASVKKRSTAIRSFLRFLIATERCAFGLDAAIPPLAQWRLRYLAGKGAPLP